MPFKSIGDIMIPLDDYPQLPHWLTLRQALAEIAKFEEDSTRDEPPGGALVFDEAYRLLGLLRRRDIMRGIGPKYLSQKLKTGFEDIAVQGPPDLWELSFDKTVKSIRERSEQRVSSVMQPIVTTLDFNDPVTRAIIEIVTHDLIVIPVLKDGKVAGVVNTVCVCDELARLIL